MKINVRSETVLLVLDGLKQNSNFTPNEEVNEIQLDEYKHYAVCAIVVNERKLEEGWMELGGSPGTPVWVEQSTRMWGKKKNR